MPLPRTIVTVNVGSQVANLDHLNELDDHLDSTGQTAILVGDNGDAWRINNGILTCLTRRGEHVGDHGIHIESDTAAGAYLPLTILWAGAHRP